MTRTGSTGNTESRILNVAISSFVRYGYSGTRVQKIADEAGANIRMIYHYFENKRGLFRAVLHETSTRHAATNETLLANPPTTLAELAVTLHDSYMADTDRVRLLLWESLEHDVIVDEGAWLNLEERQQAIESRVGIIRAMQTKGHLDIGIDPEALYVLLIGMAAAPNTFPATVASANTDADRPFAERYRDTILKMTTQLGML